MMNVIICDPSRSDADKLGNLLRVSGVDVSITIFGNAHEVLRHLRMGVRADVCFFEVIMPDKTGIELAEILRAEGFLGEIVFVSASNNYAAESYSVGAFSYISKPAASTSIHAVIRKLEALRTSADGAGILVKMSGIMKFLLFRDISHIEVIRRKVYFRLINGGEIETTATFAEIAAILLRDKRFIQCHRSFIVNMDDISQISSREIITHRSVKIIVSRNFSNIKNDYIKWRSSLV